MQCIILAETQQAYSFLSFLLSPLTPWVPSHHSPTNTLLSCASTCLLNIVINYHSSNSCKVGMWNHESIEFIFSQKNNNMNIWFIGQKKNRKSFAPLNGVITDNILEFKISTKILYTHMLIWKSLLKSYFKIFIKKTFPIVITFTLFNTKTLAIYLASSSIFSLVPFSLTNSKT